MLKSILSGLIEHLATTGFRTALDLVDKGFICQDDPLPKKAWQQKNFL